LTALVITGAGLLTSLGRDRREVRAAVRAGRSGVRPCAALAGLPVEVAGEVPDFDPARDVGRTKNLKYMSRASALAVVAARAAHAEAGLAPADEVEGEDLGCYAGLGMTSSETRDLERLVRASLDEKGDVSLALVGKTGLRATNPLISFKILTNMPLCHVAMSVRARGPNLALNSLGGETLSVLAEACHDVREGRARAALVGGVDAQLDRAGVLQLTRKRLLSGRSLAEGAAFVVVEREEAARARGAKVLATIEAIGLAPSGRRSLEPAPEAAIRGALARVPETRVVFASLSGEPEGDAAETRALAGREVVATRRALGDAFAASSAIDLVLALEELSEPVTIVAAGSSATVGACVLA
jgi:3-oxoacyl-[acyl-carrier-protein] synthase II